MYYRSTIGIDGGVMFCRHTNVDLNRQSLVFIHGLGDSGLAFFEAFHEPGLREYNIIAPDLLGYGKSKPEAHAKVDYRFRAQIARLYVILDRLKIGKFFLVGHSMGGDIGTLMCNSDRQARIQAFVNVEGDLTQGDRFITTVAVDAHKKGEKHFEYWLRHQLLDIIFKDKTAKFKVSRRRYEKSLNHSSTKAFWENVKNIRRLNKNLPNHHYAQAAKLFRAISIPKVFYWGSESLSEESRDFLNAVDLKSIHKMFKDSFHWIMLDNREEFYNSLAEFLAEAFNG